MSEASRGFVASAEHKKLGPDYFGFYTCEVAELFSQDQDFLPFSSQTSELAGRTSGVVREKDISKHSCNGKEANSFTSSGSLFSNSIGPGISDFKKERLKALLRQSVIAYTQETDEMLDPVVAMSQIKSHLRCRKRLSSYSGAADGDAGKISRKKLKMSLSASSTSLPVHASPASCGFGEGSGSEGMNSKFLDVSLSEKRISNPFKNCACCQNTETSNWRNGPDGPKSLCNACGIKFEQGRESLSIKKQERVSVLGSNDGAVKENGEVNDDLRFLLENDSLQVNETVKKHSDEISSTLGHMGQKIEELLDIVMSIWRPMTLAEKQQLRKLIQKLPPENLDRVVEIIRQRRPSETHSCDEIHVDLEKEDNVTLWRLYYCVEAVGNARKLSK